MSDLTQLVTALLDLAAELQRTKADLEASTKVFKAEETQITDLVGGSGVNIDAQVQADIQNATVKAESAAGACSEAARTLTDYANSI